MKTFVIKYGYVDMYGFGSVIIFADTMEEAINIFINHMHSTGGEKWFERTYNRNVFRYKTSNVFGWHVFFNDSENVCLKIREINTDHGEIIPIQEYFEEPTDYDDED